MPLGQNASRTMNLVQGRQLKWYGHLLRIEEYLPVDTARKEKRKTVTIMEKPNE